MDEACAIYCRISREDEGRDESESISNQRALLMEYAFAQHWLVAGIYVDEDMSGMNRERPRWNAMLRDAQRGRFSIILCKTQSRFTRDMEMVEKYIHGLFPQWGIRFVAVVDHVDTQVRGNKKARQINGLINEWYLEDLSENIRSVLEHKRRCGEYLGSRPLYGYRKDPDDRHRLLVDEDTAPVVRWIYGQALQGCGKHAIAQRLNAMAVPPPGGNRDGWGLWNKTTVGRILRNEMYAGTLVQGKSRRVSYKSTKTMAVPQEAWVRVPGHHEAIIPPEVFARVQALQDARPRADGRGDIHPLAGLVRCMDCGAAMVRGKNRGGDAGTAYLVCRRYHLSGGAQCTRHGVRMDALTAAVRQEVERLLAEAGCALCPPPAASLPRQRANTSEGVQQALALCDKALASLYMDKVKGILSEEEFLRLRQDIAQRRETWMGRLQEAEEEAPVPENGTGWLRAWFLSLLETVRIGEADRSTGEQGILLCWKV